MPATYVSPNGRWRLIVLDSDTAEIWDDSTQPPTLRRTVTLAEVQQIAESRPNYIPVNQWSDFQPTARRTRHNLEDRLLPPRFWHQGVLQ